MRVQSWSVAVAGWGVLIPLLVITPAPPVGALVLFLVLAIVTRWIIVPLPRGGYQSPGLAVVTAGIVFLGPVHTALTMGAGVVLGNGIVRRRPYLTNLFNSGQFILSILFAGAVFQAAHPEHPTVLAPLFTGAADPSFILAFASAVLGYILINTLFVSARVAARESKPVLSVFVPNLLWAFVNNLVFASLGVVLALIIRHALPTGAVLVTIPLVLMAYILMLYSTHEEAHRELAVVERIGRELMTLDLEQVYETMYEQIREVMSADTFYVALYDAARDALTLEFLMDSGERFPKREMRFSRAVREVVTQRASKWINRTPIEMAATLSRDEELARIGRTDRRSASLLFAPIVKGPQVIGLLSVQSYEYTAYTERHLRVLEAIATQAATAIENARLFESSRRSVERLTTLQEISSVIASNLEMEKVLQSIVESSRQVLEVDRCAIYLGTEQTGEITDVHARGLSESYLDAVKHGFTTAAGGALLKLRQPLIIEDAQTDQRMGPLREAVAREGIRTMALLPLLYHGELVGALAYYHDRVRPYSPEDVSLAQAIADEAAIAVTNATLLAQTQRRAAEANLLNRVMRVVTETLDFKEISRRIVEEIAVAFGYSHISIRRREGDYLVLQAQVGYSRPYETLHLSKGIVGRVARTGKPVLLPDINQDQDYIVTDPVICSEAAVPIVIDDQVVGVLNVETAASRPLFEADLDLLTAMARQLGTAMRNASLYDQARHARDELRVLYEAAKTISSSLELQVVLDSLVQVTCKAFGYEYGGILLIDDRNGDLLLEATYGYPLQIRGYRVPSGKGVTGWVQRTGKPAIVPDVRQDSRYVSFNEGIASEIAVPLIIEGRVMGVFNIESTRERAFGERDLEVLTTLAGYATIAIENARLFEETKRLAITDGLTELYNHRYLHEAMERTLDRCQRDDQSLALIMLEIDNFKRFNDTYGHQRGDEVLRIVADLLRKSSRTSDFVARYGGDEFMVVLPNTSKTSAQDIAERIRRTVEAYPFLLGENIVTSVTLSVGIAASPDDGTTVEAVVQAVDSAQYTAKRSGGNKVHSAQPLSR